MIETLEQNALAAPKNTNAWIAFAQAASATNDWERAERAFAHLHSLAPTHAAILRNWLRAKEHLGQTVEAIGIAANWLKRFPDDRAMWRRVASLAALGKHHDTEESAHRNLARLEPTDVAHVFNHACALSALDRHEEARERVTEGLAQWPDDIRLRWFNVVETIPVPESREHIRSERASAARALEEIVHWDGDAAHAHDAIVRSGFYFTYHGVNDVARTTAVAEQATRLARACIPQSAIDALRQQAPTRISKKIRIAFVSVFWQQHTISKYFGGWLKHFDREQFEIVLVHDNTHRDAVTDVLEAGADIVARPSADKKMAQVLAELALDVLIYVDVGMVARHIPLYAYRFAPLQLAAWGHPSTTGYAEIDGYISVAVMEPPDARTHHTERELIQLPGLGIHIASPSEVPMKSSSAWRRAANISDDANVIICLQSLFKIHPDDDEIFSQVLAATVAQNTQLVLFVPQQSIAVQFRKRFEGELRARGVAETRIVFLPMQSYANFLNIICDSAVVLDTHHFSGGSTSIDTLACGTPIVTFPGEFMRGRQTAGMLLLSGLSDDVVSSVDEYISRVQHHLNTPLAQRENVRALRRAAAKGLWNDLAPVRALENAITRLLKNETH